MRILKKRGQFDIQLKPVIEALAGIAILFLFMYVGRAFGSGEVFQKVKISTEAALTTNALYSLPDNSFVIYSEDMSKYSIKFDQSSVKTLKIEGDPLGANRVFVKSAGPKIDFTLEKPSKLLIGKSGNSLDVSSDKPLILNKQRCPSIETQKPIDINIIPKTHQEKTYDFTNTLSSLIPNSKTKDLTELEQETELVLQVIPSAEQNKIKAYIAPDLRSRRLACLILNNLLTSNPDLTTPIIPLDRSYFKSPYIGVALEISKEFETQITLVAIQKALEDY